MRKEVPLFKQWDEKWADYPYGDSIIATAGCAPTSFAMIAQFYGATIIPPDAADFSVSYGYYPTDGGTSWDFFAAAGQQFNAPMHQTNDPDEVLAALKEGKPCIGAHGPGEFTQDGHIIVYAYINDQNEVMVNDPNREDTCKFYAWEFLVEDNANSGYVAFVSEKVPEKN
jgi:hypothetical protein